MKPNAIDVVSHASQRYDNSFKARFAALRHGHSNINSRTEFILIIFSLTCESEGNIAKCSHAILPFRKLVIERRNASPKQTCYVGGSSGGSRD